MIRALLPLLAGAVLGASAMFLARHVSPPSESPQPAAFDAADSSTAPVSPAAGARGPQAVDELEQLAGENPSAALDRLASLEGFARADAVAAVASELARTDPVGGLEAIAALRGGLATALRNEMLEQWALVDPAGLLAYLASIDSTRELMTLVGEFPRWTQTLGAVAPELVLESASSLPARARLELERLAMRALAESEPVRAAALTAATADRTLRDGFAISIGSLVGAHDPDFALEWLEGMEAPHWNAISNVIGGIADTDLARAVEIVLTTPWGERAQTIMLSGTGNLELSTAEAQPIAERIAAASDHPLAPTVMRYVIRAWAERDFDAALAWAVANESRLVSSGQSSPSTAGGFRLASRSWNLLGDLAGVARQRDLTTAMSYVAELPAERRGEWIQTVVGDEAMRNPEQALRLIEPYRGEPFFDAAFRDIVTRTAMMSSPAQAASMLDRAPAQTREQLASMVVERWAESDPGAARRWVETLPQGAQRDRGIAGILAGRAKAGVFDAALLSEFSDPVTMQRSLLSVVSAMGTTQPDVARRVIEEHISDPNMRATATSVLESAARRPR